MSCDDCSLSFEDERSLFIEDARSLSFEDDRSLSFEVDRSLSFDDDDDFFFLSLCDYPEREGTYVTPLTTDCGCRQEDGALAATPRRQHWRQQAGMRE